MAARKGYITVSAKVLRKYSASSLYCCGNQSLRSLLYLARFSKYKHFLGLHFLQKIRKFKMAAIIGETKMFRKLRWLLCRDTLWVKSFVEITLSSTVFEI